MVEAVERGVEGFKVICSHFYPGDPRAKKVYRASAEMNRSILFHSGILWDGLPSSKYNRPAEFEELIDIVGLKFALAHISWPWTDECIALFGKYQNAYETNGLDTARMYIDLTPGTPPIYREEALYRVFKTGYNIEKNIIFGTDNVMHTYDVALSDEYLDRDLEIYRKLGLSDQVVEDVLKNNVREFSDSNNRAEPRTKPKTKRPRTLLSQSAGGVFCAWNGTRRIPGQGRQAVRTEEHARRERTKTRAWAVPAAGNPSDAAARVRLQRDGSRPDG